VLLPERRVRFVAAGNVRRRIDQPAAELDSALESAADGAGIGVQADAQQRIARDRRGAQLLEVGHGWSQPLAPVAYSIRALQRERILADETLRAAEGTQREPDRLVRGAERGVRIVGPVTVPLQLRPLDEQLRAGIGPMKSLGSTSAMRG